MGYFPFFMDLSNQRGLIVGGGTVALRKVEKLLPYGPKLSVVAPSFVPELECIPELELLERDFRPSDLERACFVVAATDDKSLNHEISALCQGRGIPVNVADDKAACSFLFPALVRRGELSIGISTGGASPTAAIWLKEQMNALLPENMEEILGWLEQLRPVLKARFSGEKERSALFARLFYACLEANGPLTDEQLREILSQEVLFP